MGTTVTMELDFENIAPEDMCEAYVLNYLQELIEQNCLSYQVAPLA